VIRLHIKIGILGEAGTFTNRIEWTGQSATDIIAIFHEHVPQVQDVAVSCNGRLLTAGELTLSLPDDCDLVIAPELHLEVIATALVYALISAAVGFAVNYVMSLLMPPPKPDGVQQDRGDEASPTNAWDGVQTNYGQGLIVPYVYGRRVLGGQVIYTDVFGTSAGGSVQEFLRVILALTEGRIHKIGGLDGGLFGEANGLGGFAGGVTGGTIPTGIRVNGNVLDSTNFLPGAKVWFRAGELDQSPPPLPFVGATSTLVVSEQLDDENVEAIFTVTASAADISLITFLIAFPAGLYQQDAQGNIGPYPVTFEVTWREPGASFWQFFFRPQTTQPLTSVTVGQGQARLGSEVLSFGGALPMAGVRAPIEVRVKRITPQGGTNVVSSALWRQSGVNFNHTFAYPRVAWLGLEMLATSKVSGGMPQYEIPVDGLRVRVYDTGVDASPSEARYWDIPAAGDPYVGIWTYPVGQNPAWVLADFLTSPWGLGEWLNDTNVDWDRFAEWAVFCDEEPNGAGWSEPRCAIDLVADVPRPAWEIVLAICRAGHAMPVMRGKTISVVYQYRDAHSAGAVSVPAKAPLQLFTSGNVEDLQTTWLPKANRPTVVHYQFNNADKNYAPDVLPIEDLEALLGDPTSANPDKYRPETIQAFGIVRSSQLVRDGLFYHRANRLITREVSFRTGPWALGAENGDLVEVEHDVLRPFDTDVPLGMQVTVGGAATATVTVDHAVTIGGSTLEIVVRNPDGAPERSDISTATPVTGGTQLGLVGTVTVDAGAPCSVGVKDKITEVYQIVSANLAQTGKREVRVLEWQPTLYDEPDSDAVDAAPPDHLPTQSDAQDADDAATDLKIIAKPDGGGHLVTWSKPPNREKSLCRVYARPEGLDFWTIAGETAESFESINVTPFSTYEVAVVVENALGVFPLPDDQTIATIVPGEFPPISPPRVTNVRATEVEDGIRYEWDALEVDGLDYYEVRAGAYFATAAVRYRGTTPAFFDVAPPQASGEVFISARSTSGLYSYTTASVAAGGWTPPGTAAVITRSELPTPTGSLSGLSYAASPTGKGNGVIKIDDGVSVGTYETLELDAGYQAPFFWKVGRDHQEIDVAAEVDDLDFALDSGEARWRTVDTRPASPGITGVDWQTTVDDLSYPIDDVADDLRVQGHVGEAGTHTTMLVESRFYTDGVWGSWLTHVDRVVVASKIQVRITLGRESSGYAAYCTELALTAYL